MGQSDDLAKWAASFVQLYSVETESTAESRDSSVQSGATIGTKLTQAALLLLDAVDRGGVPAFMTSNLKQIALDNGIAVSESTSPNEVITALRIKSKAG